MPGKTILARQLKLQEKENKIAEVWAKSNSHLKTYKENKSKKRPYTELLDYIYFQTLPDYEGLIVNTPETYKAKSYNFDKQLYDFVKHVFVKYKAPDCLIYNFLAKYKTTPTKYNKFRKYDSEYAFSSETIQRERKEYLDWFYLISHSGGFNKYVSNIMTSKEAHIFMTNNYYREPRLAFWYAKLLGKGINHLFAEKLVDKLFLSFIPNTHNVTLLKSLIDFFVNYQNQFAIHDLDEILDYIKWQFPSII